MKKSPYQPPPNLENYEFLRSNFKWEDSEKEFFFHTTGKSNYAYEVTDHQVTKGNGDKPAIISQKPNGEIERITFEELARKTTILAGQLQKRGLKAGDRFGMYASKSIEYVVALLAAIKCGAIVVPLFEAFGKDAITDRLGDCGATWLYVNNHLVKNVDFLSISSLTDVITNDPCELPSNLKHHLLKDLMVGEEDSSVIQFGDMETPFIIHYTSGSTAKPKGILLVQRAMVGHFVTAKYVLDLHPEDRYWNSGDPGWVTGMVYNFFAPLLLGVTAHLYEGPFQPLEWMKFMSRMDISVWYSTPTAFRLLRYYSVPLNSENMPSLRHIVSAGEPLNSSLIDWTEENLGIPIHDSWYMTENGHQLINNYRSLPIRKGSMGKPLPGIYAAIIDEEGNEVSVGTLGRLAVKIPWPGLMKTVWNNPKKFESYFQNEWYISGDTAYQDDDGYFWFQGRDDDMIKSAAERISPFEIENTLVSHPKVAEAGVIGKAHDLYGNIIKAFVLVKPGTAPDNNLKNELVKYVREHLAAHEVPREIEFVEKLPKTRSGKIMRRVLRAREMNLDTGDLSTLDAEMNPTKDK
jgi:acetyl-CoA synthetase